MRFSDSFCGISQKLLKYKKTSSRCGLPPVLPTGKSKEQLPVCCLALSLEGSHCSEEIHKPGPDNAEPQTSPWKKWAVKVKDSLLFTTSPKTQYLTYNQLSFVCQEALLGIELLCRIPVFAWSPANRSWKRGLWHFPVVVSPQVHTTHMHMLIYYLARKLRDRYLPKMSL